MLHNFLVFLPVAAALFWIAVHILMANRAKGFSATVILLFFLSAHLYADACYANAYSLPSTLLSSSLLAQLVTPAIIPLAGVYLSRLRFDGPIHWRYLLWIFFPSSLFSAALVICLLEGPEKIQSFLEAMYVRRSDVSFHHTDGLVQAYYFVTVTLFKAVLILEAVIGSISTLFLMYRNNLRMRHFRKFFTGGRIRVLEIQFFLAVLSFFVLLAKTLLSRELLVQHHWIAIVHSFLLVLTIFAFGYTALFSSRRSVSLRDMKYAFRFNYSPHTRSETEEEILADLVDGAGKDVLRNAQLRITQRLQEDRFQQDKEIESSGIHAAISTSWDDDSLLSRFEEYIFVQKGFLEPGITLIGVSERLSTNKTYVSRLVNSTYNMPFPDLINSLRIDYAREYLAGHTTARQNEVAQACGFSSAASFNSIFKKITGMTPKIWLATHE